MGEHTPQKKPGAWAPGVCLLSRGAAPRGSGVAARSVDRQIRMSSVVVGAAGAGTWGQVSIGTFHWVRGTSGGAMDGDSATRQERHIWSEMLEQGPDRQRTPVWCSGGVSSINGASESRWHHDGSGGWGQQERQRDPHPSLPRETGLHEREACACWATATQRAEGGRRPVAAGFRTRSSAPK